ncbi:hypothetical protein [Rhodocaloribacter sp.]
MPALNAGQRVVGERAGDDGAGPPSSVATTPVPAESSTPAAPARSRDAR